MPAGMYVENFNSPADVGGSFVQVGISPVGLESYPSAGVVQLNGQKVSPTFLDALSVASDVISSGTLDSPYRSYTLDAFRFAVGSYYDPAAATISVPTGDLTW